MGCCWAFQHAHDHDLEVYFRWLDKLFTGALDGALVGLALEAASEELDGVVPMSDEYGFPLAVQAQGGVRALLLAVDALLGDESSLEEAATCVIEAVDSYTASMFRAITGRLEAPEAYELLTRECVRQLHDARFLTDVDARRPPELVAWRLENRQYAIPIAAP